MLKPCQVLLEATAYFLVSTRKCELEPNIAFNLVMISNRLFVNKTKFSILYNVDIEGLRRKLPPVRITMICLLDFKNRTK